MDIKETLLKMACEHRSPSMLDIYQDYLIENGLDAGEVYELEELFWPEPPPRGRPKMSDPYLLWSQRWYPAEWEYYRSRVRRNRRTWKRHRKTQYKPKDV